MHRSGTSCLTGLLQQQGLVLGKHYQWNRFNQRGNRENQDFLDINSELLTASGGDWRHPPKRLRWDNVLERRALALCANFPADLHWGFKDPRSLLLTEFWDSLLPGLQSVGIFRHPNAVMKSLLQREGSAIDEAEALSLWCHYNRRLVERYRKAPFPLLCFDWDRERFLEATSKAAARLGLSAELSAQSFYDGALIHYQAMGEQGLRGEALKLYRELGEASADSMSDQGQ